MRNRNWRIALAAAVTAAAACGGASVLSAQQDSLADSTRGLPQSSVPMPTEAPPTVDLFNPDSPSPTVDRVVAVVGKAAITWSDLLTAVNQRRAAGMPFPRDSAGQLQAGRSALDGLIDEEVLVQKARELEIIIDEAEVSARADYQVKNVRATFSSEQEYRDALQGAGLGTPQEYRRFVFDQVRRALLQQRVIAELQKTEKLGSVSEAEIDTVYERHKDQLQRTPAQIAFRQLVIAPKASPAADSAAKAKADSILAELKAGADFAQMARRESMDPGSKEQGGDLGWNRRGSGFVPEFERAMFSLRPGELSKLVKTSFGYHIIKVDRVQPAEVRARHILIAPEVRPGDITIARQLADSVAQAWREGAPFDSLVKKFHDPVEEKGVLHMIPIDSLPPAYKLGLGDAQPEDVTMPFELKPPSGGVKFAVLQVVARTEEGEYTLAEVRDNIRLQLAQEKQIRAILDRLREQVYVSVRY